MWFNSAMNSLRKLSTSYNSVLRRLLGISQSYSASNMFVSRGILTFSDLLQNLYAGLHHELIAGQILVLPLVYLL